jgi:hypothetical protein
VTDDDGVYRTEGGLVFRVHKDAEGHLTVETLLKGSWVPGRIGMVGLRVMSTTRRLTPGQVAALGT